MTLKKHCLFLHKNQAYDPMFNQKLFCTTHCIPYSDFTLCFQSEKPRDKLMFPTHFKIIHIFLSSDH